jgi:hypothetical protein
MGDNLDLNIENYDLDDLLNLFNIPKNFDEIDLKKAKQIVLKTHPDKSKLPRDYFIFYSKAYKTIYSIWEFRQKVGQTTNTEYIAEEMDEEEKKVLLDRFFNKNEKMKKDKKEFNQWFNEQFEKNRLKSEMEEKGYGDWLKEQDVNNDTRSSSVSSMHEEFERKKIEARSLVVRQEIQDIWSPNSINAANLSGGAPQTYDSHLFSGLGYQDLYKAHQTENVIPVTEDDFNSVKKFNNVNEFVNYRNGQDTTPLSEQQALQYLKQREKKEDEQSVARGYELAKQVELANRNQQGFWSNIQLLK